MKKENLYLIEVSNDSERFYKIGVTVHRYCRFYEIMKVYPNVTIKYMIIGLEFDTAYRHESLLHNLFEPYKPKKHFGGYTECFSDINIDTFKNLVLSIINSNNTIVENLEISWR